MAKGIVASIAAGSVLLLLSGCASRRTESGERETAERPVRDGLYWTERAYPTGDKDTSVILLESGTPAEVSQGMPYEYVLKVTNLSKMNLDNVVVVDKPEGNFQLQSSDPRTEPGDDLRWQIGSLKPGQSRMIRVRGSATSEGQVTHCAEVDWRALFCSTTQVVRPELAITMRGTAATLQCDPITYTVTVSNGGSGTTRNVVIEDRLPDGVRTLDGKESVRFTVPALKPGESKEFEWQAVAQHTGRFTTAATATADGNLTAKAGPITTTVTKPKLLLEQEATKQTYMGRVIVYDMSLRNAGDGDARDVVLADTLPAGVEFIEASEGGVLDGDVVRWKLGTLEPGATRRLYMKLSSPEPAMIRNRAMVTAYCADPVTHSVQTKVVGIPAILLEVVDVDDPVEIGGATTYVITATNQGSAPATNIRIAVDLEETMGYLGAEGATSTLDTGRRVTFRPLATLDPGKKATWRVQVKAAREGDVRIKVVLTSDQLTRPVEETEATTFFE